jgi:hypothetical protein
MTAVLEFAAIVLLAVAVILGAVRVSLLERRVGVIARLHVTLMFELAAGDWENAETDLAALEGIGGAIDKAFPAAVRATIQAGRERRIAPNFDPMAGKHFDEETQSYVPDA